MPSLREFTYMADQSFTKAQLLAMEGRVVQGLRFNVHTVNSFSFLDRFTRAAGSSHKETALVHYLCELMLLHYEFLAFRPSLRAAAAIFLARATLSSRRSTSPSRCGPEAEEVWTPTLCHYTGYTPRQLEACVRLLQRVHVTAEWSPHTALRAKFSDSRCLHVAELTSLTDEQLQFA